MLQINDITYRINGCAMNVHRTLGNGFQEVIYQRCLAIEMTKHNLLFQREPEQIIYYLGANVGSRRADFVVEDLVVVELKALLTLEDVHIIQAKNYLIAYNYTTGLLINFGSRSLQTKKIFNPNFLNVTKPKPDNQEEEQ